MLSITIRRFWIKLTRWEYWPTWIVYFPVFVYYLYLSLKSGSLLFFTRVNPGMEMGGLFGASKYRQLEHLSDDFKPITLLFQPDKAIQDLLDILNRTGIKYPFILKPDFAERGRGVHLVEDESYLQNLLTKVSYPFIVQEYIQGEYEAGVFVYKIPGNTKIEIPSLVIKEFLTVQGDGRSSLRELMLKKDRALLALPKLSKRLGSKMFEIPPDNEVIQLEPIGNHNRGTKFKDGRHLIHPGMYDFYARIASQLPDFFYGRFDLRANSQHEFLNNRNIKILEVNGVNAEPAHIYDPGTSLMSGIVTLLKHWNIIYNIARANQSNGYPLQTYKKALQHYRQWRKAIRI